MASKRNEDWHWAAVKAALTINGKTLEQIADENGFQPKSLSRVKTVRWHKAQAAIAAAIDKTPQEIWPRRYEPDGRPLTGRLPNQNVA